MRKRLPETRPSQITKVTVGGYEAYLTVGFYENNQPGEIFIKLAKEGTSLSGFADGLALVASLALQYDVPLTAILSKWRHTRFEPADDKASSLLDAFAQAAEKCVSDFGGLPDLGYDGKLPPNVVTGRATMKLTNGSAVESSDVTGAPPQGSENLTLLALPNVSFDPQRFACGVFGEGYVVDDAERKLSIAAFKAGWNSGRHMGVNIAPGSFVLCMDGDKWCARRSDFVNLQESHAGFGSTPRVAMLALLHSEGATKAELEKFSGDARIDRSPELHFTVRAADVGLRVCIPRVHGDNWSPVAAGEEMTYSWTPGTTEMGGRVLVSANLAEPKPDPKNPTFTLRDFERRVRALKGVTCTQYPPGHPHRVLVISVLHSLAAGLFQEKLSGVQLDKLVDDPDPPAQLLAEATAWRVVAKNAAEFDLLPRPAAAAIDVIRLFQELATLRRETANLSANASGKFTIEVPPEAVEHLRRVFNFTKCPDLWSGPASSSEVPEGEKREALAQLWTCDACDAWLVVGPNEGERVQQQCGCGQLMVAKQYLTVDELATVVAKL